MTTQLILSRHSHLGFMFFLSSISEVALIAGIADGRGGQTEAVAAVEYKTHKHTCELSTTLNLSLVLFPFGFC